MLLALDSHAVWHTLCCLLRRLWRWVTHTTNSSPPLPLCPGDTGDPGQLADQGQHQHYASQAQLAAGGWDQTGIPWDPSVPANQVRPPHAHYSLMLAVHL